MEPQDGNEEGFGAFFWMMFMLGLFGVIGFGLVLAGAGM
jgi:hypothetical protein